MDDMALSEGLYKGRTPENVAGLMDIPTILSIENKCQPGTIPDLLPPSVWYPRNAGRPAVVVPSKKGSTTRKQPSYVKVTTLRSKMA